MKIQQLTQYYETKFSSIRMLMPACVYESMNPKYIAANESGTVRLYSEEPTAGATSWISATGERLCAHVLNVEFEGEDWRDTLTKIPSDLSPCDFPTTVTLSGPKYDAPL